MKQNQRLLLLSSSRKHGVAFLEYALMPIQDFLGDAIQKVLFIPYARVLSTLEEFERDVQAPFSQIGYQVESIHHAENPLEAVNQAQAIAVGGGNTFQLLSKLYELDILNAIQKRVQKGVPYIGWSAGSNLTCPTIRTTNDMPIVEPPSFKALNLVPFQINPHYTTAHPEKHQGETREERLREFLEVNPNIQVVGLPEGNFLRVEGSRITHFGETPMVVFQKGAQTLEYSHDASVDFLANPKQNS